MWLVGGGLILLLHLWALPQLLSESPLRADSDTAVMLDAIRNAGGLAGATRWLVGDWLLENGFYRPISSLSLTIDYALYGEQAWGYRLTNLLLLIATAFGIAVLGAWFNRRVGLEPSEPIALGYALLFTLQTTGATAWLRLPDWLMVAGVLVGLLVGGYRQRGSLPFQSAQWGVREWLILVLGVGALYWGVSRGLGVEYARLVSWVPSRTALLGTALSVWATYWLFSGLERGASGRIVLGGMAYLLALGSYEQPITLVPILTGSALLLRKQFGKGVPMVVGLVLASALVYILLRLSLVTTEPTAYQRQQLRSSLQGPILDYLTEMIPPTMQWGYWQAVGLQLEVFLFAEPWRNLLLIVFYGGVVWIFWRHWRILLPLLAWHGVTYLPMAFLHPFEHYRLLPQVAKTAFDGALVVLAVGLIGRLLVRNPEQGAGRTDSLLRSQ